MDLDLVSSLLSTSSIGRRIVYLPTTTSTMDVAREHVHGGAPSGLVVVADEQSAGRGRFGRAWVAPPAVNLLCTVLVRPTLEVAKRLGMVTPLAVADAVAAVGGPTVSFKWPNDVRAGGRKLCGILIEGEFAGERPAFALVGIGLNVNLDVAHHPEIADIATSIMQEIGAPVSRERTLAALLNAFEAHADNPDGEALRVAWRARLETLGQDVTVSFGGAVEHGRAEDVDAAGSLILRRADGSAVILPAGEVSLRLPAPAAGSSASSAPVP
ncbi:MAG: biotin--[acetyl-CoA-carboxylase] ligase [Dehalococcoidia bacterium]